MGPLKYIRYSDVQFVIFPASIPHDKALPIHNRDLINGAGFCRVSANPSGEGVIVHTWGKSTALSIESHELDEYVLTNGLNRRG